MARLADASGNLRAALESRRAAQVAAAEAAEAEKRKAEQGSLAALFRVYVSTLQGRQSHYDAQSIFRLHVAQPFPILRPVQRRRSGRGIAGRARTPDRRGKGRTAAKLRAYLRAAFGLAMRAGLDPTLPEALTSFGIQINPADRLPSLAQFSKALDRTLTLTELRAFWRRLDCWPRARRETPWSAACSWGATANATASPHSRDGRCIRSHADAAGLERTESTCQPPAACPAHPMRS